MIYMYFNDTTYYPTICLWDKNDLQSHFYLIVKT